MRTIKKIVFLPIVIDGKLLVINHGRFSKKWDLPGGMVFFGEKITTAADRILHQQAGYRCQTLGISKLYNYSAGTQDAIIFSLAIKLAGGKLEKKEGKAKWIPVEEALSDSRFNLRNGNFSKKMIRDFNELKPVPIALIEDLRLDKPIIHSDIFNFMTKLFNHERFPTKLFVISSIIAFILFFSAFVFAESRLTKNPRLTDRTNDARYTINTGYQDGDGLITRVPKLKDMLSGPIISDKDPSKGDARSKITLVVFSDFDCKFCRDQEQILEDAAQKYETRLIWKDFPSRQTESPSYRASLAGRCAQNQGKFWEFHDAVFQTEDKSDNGLRKIAGQIDLDTKKFSDCLDTLQTKPLVDDDMKEADALGITGVPSIFINDRAFVGQIDADELGRTIEALKK